MLILISCGGQATEAAPGTAGDRGAHGADPYRGLNLVVPNRYNPPIEMSSVTTVNATVKFLDGNDIYNNIWTRTYQDVLGIKLTYKWVVDGSMYGQKLGLSINSGDIPDMFVVSPAQLLMYQEAGLLSGSDFRLRCGGLRQHARYPHPGSRCPQVGHDRRQVVGHPSDRCFRHLSLGALDPPGLDGQARYCRADQHGGCA